MLHITYEPLNMCQIFTWKVKQKKEINYCSLAVKSSRNKKNLNDVNAETSFFAAGSWEKDTKNGATVTSLMSFLFCDDFSIVLTGLRILVNTHGSYIVRAMGILRQGYKHTV